MDNIKTRKNRVFILVRERGLEPPRPKALVPKTSVSTNSTTRANLPEQHQRILR